MNRFIESLMNFITSLNRLENEHLNNVGHYRAVKTVPLPFRENDSDFWGQIFIQVKKSNRGGNQQEAESLWATERESSLKLVRSLPIHLILNWSLNSHQMQCKMCISNDISPVNWLSKLWFPILYQHKEKKLLISFLLFIINFSLV